jgi:hypothetical protein
MIRRGVLSYELNYLAHPAEGRSERSWFYPAYQGMTDGVLQCDRSEYQA